MWFQSARAKATRFLLDLTLGGTFVHAAAATAASCCRNASAPVNLLSFSSLAGSEVLARADTVGSLMPSELIKTQMAIEVILPQDCAMQT